MIYSPLIKPDHSKRLNPQKIGQLLVFLFLTGLLSPGQNCGRTEEPTDPDSIRHVDGFKIELLRSATNGEDSWISMCFDDRGRILLGLDTMGVGRLTLGKGTPPSFEKIENSLKHCRGVLFAYNSIYVNATDSKKLVRLLDQDQDDRFESRVELIDFDYRSRYGHGSNQMRLGPDGMIYIVIGNDVSFPPEIQESSPYRKPKNDWLLPESRDQGHDNRVGFILRMDRYGNQREIVAGGLRNQVDIDFDINGEMFTFDADMEWDIGAPWYRPIRVNHIVSGGEYGWRWGTGKWPAYYPDSLPSNLDVGMGSPTGVVFGTHSAFPEKYRQALFMADWQNGKILVAHKKPAGASYSFDYESFLDGAPLNVCDLEFGPDGNLYFITGGRGSQSALYRVSWSKPITKNHPGKAGSITGLTAPQTRRRKIERFHGKPNTETISNVWKDLGNTDPWIRHAARIAVERQPTDRWEEKVFSENRPEIALNGLVAITRMKKTSAENRLTFQSKVTSKLTEIFNLATPKNKKDDKKKLILMIRICGILFARHGEPDSATTQQMVDLFSRHFPHPNETLNRELCELLVYLGATDCFAAAFSLLDNNTTSQETQIHLARSLAHIKQPWPIEHNRIFAEWLDRARQFRGGHLLPKTIRQMQDDFLNSLAEKQKTKLTKSLEVLKEPVAKRPVSHTREQVRNWQVADFLDINSRTGNAQRGKNIYSQAQCSSCHRKNDFGSQIGPDLTTVAKRYNRTALLESIIEPSKQIDPKYALSSYALVNGKNYTGRIHAVNKNTITLEIDPLQQTTVILQRNEIEATRIATLSPMPTGLLDYFTKDEIVDLLTYLSSHLD